MVNANWRKALKKVVRRMGYDVRRLGVGQDVYRDIRQILTTDSPLVLDVGANIGQTIDEVRGFFRAPVIHAFEPGETAFRSLKGKYGSARNIRLNKLALGSKSGRQMFFENTLTEMSSFLPFGPEGWGHAANHRDVEISTVDEYCEKGSIPHVDLLKSDTQGFDLEVLKGARQMLQARKIRLLYLEIIFAKLYMNMPRVDEIYRFIADQGFELVSFYQFHYLNDRAAWTDALFVHPQFQDRN